MKRFQWSVAVAMASLLLAACGGGGGGDAPAEADPLAAVPTEATQSAPAMVSYLTSLSRALNEAREAIDLSMLAAMFTSETAEPEPLP